MRVVLPSSMRGILDKSNLSILCLSHVLHLMASQRNPNYADVVTSDCLSRREVFIYTKMLQLGESHSVCSS